MKNPNGYGSIINLGKNRRKPFAVRVTDGYQVNDGIKKQKYRYIGYYEKAKDANIALANYNSGVKIKEHVSVSNQLTFKELYNEWKEYRNSMNSKPSDSTLRNYQLAFGWCEKLHDKKFANIRVDDIQDVVDQYKSKSKSTVSFIKTVLSQMYQYAMKREMVDKNYALLVDYEWVVNEESIHAPFTDKEIDFLWKNIDLVNVDLVLMMIYTGFRASEFIGLENKNIHLKEKYVVGGMKTDAGRNRTVALNEKILPLFEKHYSRGNKYLIPNSKGSKYTYGVFYITIWNEVMEQLNMKHTPHDTRHTFATLLNRANANNVCVKMLLGHSIQDITEGTYTHKDINDLLETVNLI